MVGVQTFAQASQLINRWHWLHADVLEGLIETVDVQADMIISVAWVGQICALMQKALSSTQSDSLLDDSHTIFILVFEEIDDAVPNSVEYSIHLIAIGKEVLKVSFTLLLELLVFSYGDLCLLEIEDLFFTFLKFSLILTIKTRKNVRGHLSVNKKRIQMNQFKQYVKDPKTPNPIADLQDNVSLNSQLKTFGERKIRMMSVRVTYMSKWAYSSSPLSLKFILF